MIADTHIHIWDFRQAEYPWLKENTTLLNRNYGIQELEAQRAAVGITHGLLVQAANNLEDTDWMLKVAEKTPWMAGVVGWLPLQQPQKLVTLWEQRYRHQLLFKGVRHLIHDEPSEQWLLQPAVLESLQMLASWSIPYDVVGITTRHLEAVLVVAEKIPNLQLVLNHLNQPPIPAGEKFGRWGELMQQAATHKNIHCKISGMGTTCQKGASWTSHDIEPYVNFVLQTFGTNKCFCGGDWPVSLLAGSYTHTWQQYQQIFQKLLNEREQCQILFYNAAKFYGF
ncbi:MAG TPA: amidohydrolase family protein [Phnomibacter sp.]|nr:amidohydrolase family protein [Phnomibacter sp.]